MNKRKRAKQVVMYPAKLLKPVAGVLKQQIKQLERRKKRIEKDDPFKDIDRITDNAAPDADAEEQFGHARNTAIREQLDRKIIQSRRALARIKLGSYGICENCGKMINTDRLMVYPEATYCVNCEAKNEKK
jgi:DnaK suppressor protein